MTTPKVGLGPWVATLVFATLLFAALIAGFGWLRAALVARSQITRRVLLAALWLPAVAAAATLPRAVPAEVGMSADRLERLRTTVQGQVDRGDMAGAITAIVRRGKLIHFEKYGYLDLEGERPMPDDALFRIASMTKTFTSVGLMSLHEEAQLLLRDPVAKYLPAFTEMSVGIFSEAGELVGTEPAKMPITLVDLLRHTSGIGYSSPPGLGELYRQHELRSGTLTAPQFVERLASLPLAEEPGSAFRYSLSTDVIGHVIEVVAGERLDRFLERRIFHPLDLADTGFVVADEDLPRLVHLYAAGPRGLELAESAEDSPLRRAPVAISGGGGWGATGSLGGAVTTAHDYLRFLQMLLNGGQIDGVRILSRKSVELMTTDHLGSLPGPYPGAGFGLGFGVVRDPSQTHELGSPGVYFWGGSENTGFWVDPEEELIGLFLTQLSPFGHQDLIDRYRTLVYQAIDD